MFSALSGKKAIADDFENRTRCTIYQNRNEWQRFLRIEACNCLFKTTGRKRGRQFRKLKKERRRKFCSWRRLKKLHRPNTNWRNLKTSIVHKTDSSFQEIQSVALSGSQHFIMKSMYFPQHPVSLMCSLNEVNFRKRYNKLNKWLCVSVSVCFTRPRRVIKRFTPGWWCLCCHCESISGTGVV